jgi:YfiH family protein
MKATSEPVISEIIIPDWPAPANVKAMQTTRGGGYSQAPYDSLNFGDHVGDDPMVVAKNRQTLDLPSEPVWLEQVHGVEVVLAEQAACRPRADATVSFHRGAVCAVMTADCLPVLLCDRAGSVVGAVHAGWRGLADGVIEAAVHAMQVPPDTLLAWLGPAIGPQAFEVGDEVRDAFMAHHPDAQAAFTPSPASGEGRKYLGDMYLLARQRLNALGVTAIYGGGLCTYSDKQRFFSFRRDDRTGRMATLVWLT